MTIATATVIVAAVTLLLIAPLVILSLRGGARAPRSAVKIHASGSEEYVIRTPRGKARARLVLTLSEGIVYEITSNFRGEGPKVTYVPRTTVMIRNHIEGRMAALDDN